MPLNCITIVLKPMIGFENGSSVVIFGRLYPSGLKFPPETLPEKELISFSFLFINPSIIRIFAKQAITKHAKIQIN